MSSLMAAWMYIADSQDKRLCDMVPFSILSCVIKNILDGTYKDQKWQHIDNIHYKTQEPSLRTNIVGIVLWGSDNAIEIYDRVDIRNNTRGIPWDIGILYVTHDGVMSISLSAIRSITRKRVWPIILQGNSHEMILKSVHSDPVIESASKPSPELV